MSLKPDLLAPAGNTESFLAAMAAGADAVYLGLKHFSARMQADNFSVKEFQKMADLAHAKDVKIYLALNTMIKPNEIDKAARLATRLAGTSSVDAVIVQDLGAIEILRQCGFNGAVHLSTLAAVSPANGLQTAAQLGIKRVILPRELNLDEIKSMASACPPEIDLEIFVHGALCYCISGRCLWSSFLGGKSGLRGRCVQPCRRIYRRKGAPGRFFSCLDLGLDVLTHTLLDIPQIKCWKIEGRKKGPHYVYYTVAAYKMLRDFPNDPQAKKEAVDLLGRALSRTTCHFDFLPQRAYNPTQHDSRTDSGLNIGHVALDHSGQAFFKSRCRLLPADLIRIGCEDDPWHSVIKIATEVPKAGTYTIKTHPGAKKPKSGTQVLLIDRREKDLEKVLADWHRQLALIPEHLSAPAPTIKIRLPLPCPKAERLKMMTLRPRLPVGKSAKSGGIPALWLSPKSLNAVSSTMFKRICWWLPPIIWPNEEAAWQRLINAAVRNGSTLFVLNAPWQMAFLHRAAQVSAIAGPFCNISNALHLQQLRKLNFSGAIVSLELAADDYLSLPGRSPLPLGMITKGLWPVGVSRIRPVSAKDNEPLQSPKSEIIFSRRYGQNTWLYPDRGLDLSMHEAELAAAGYACFIHVEEKLPANIQEPTRTSSFNWELNLL